MTFEDWYQSNIKENPYSDGLHGETAKELFESAWNASIEESVRKVTHHHDLSAEDSECLRHTIEKMP